MKRADFIAIIAALGGFLFGYNTGVISGALLFLVATFHLSTIMAGIVTSTALAGAAVGAIFAGQGADRFGRHPMLAVTSLVFIIGAGVSASAGSVPHILAGRALIGLGVGAASMLTPLYISGSASRQAGLVQPTRHDDRHPGLQPCWVCLRQQCGLALDARPGRNSRGAARRGIVLFA
jgi:SP family galactose:H+ symporter-like MFS transporter